MTSFTTNRIRFLTADNIKRLRGRLIDSTALPSQPNLLLSATDSPVNQNHYNHEEDPFILAATLADKLMKNHAYTDGNKRTSLVAADMLLKLNGFKMRPDSLKYQGANAYRLEDAQVAACSNAMTTDHLAAYYKSLSSRIGFKTQGATAK